MGVGSFHVFKRNYFYKNVGEFFEFLIKNVGEFLIKNIGEVSL